MNIFFKINIIISSSIWFLFAVLANIFTIPPLVQTNIGLLINIFFDLQCIISSLYFLKHINNSDSLSKTKWFLFGLLSLISLIDSSLIIISIYSQAVYILILIKYILTLLLLALVSYALYYFVNSLRLYSTFKIIVRDALIVSIPITLLMFDNLKPILTSSLYFPPTPSIWSYIFSNIEQIIMIILGFLVLILFMASAYIIRCKRSNKILLFILLFFNTLYYLCLNIPSITTNDIFNINVLYGKGSYCILILLAICYNLTDKDLNDKDLLDEYIHINNYWPSIIIGFIPILFLIIYYTLTYVFNVNISFHKFILVIILNIILITFRDVLVRIDNKNLIYTIRQNCKLDPLAKIYNRTAFSEVVESWNKPYTLFFFDLKNFKDINDIYGHNIGDDSIISVARFLKETSCNFSHKSAYCRYGGDEFLFAVQASDMNEIKFLVDEFEKPHYITISHYNTTLCFKMNIGYSINLNNRPLLDVLREADYAMYISKQKHITSAILYTKQMETDFFRTSILKKDFTSSLKAGDFYPVFQPKICLDSLTPTGFEVLARWNHKELGLISPALFIPIAENSGKIVDLDIYIFKKACEFQRILRSNDIYQQCSVNISLKTLKQSNFIELLLSILNDYDLPTSVFTLEIIENIAIDKNNYILPKINELKTHGFLISIDDFGTDYSSLNRLFQLPFDELKIPREFVINFKNDRQAAILDSIAYMASKLKIHTVVEGIETLDQVHFFKSLGFNVIQGYYFSKPLSSDEYLDYINGKQLDKKEI